MRRYCLMALAALLGANLAGSALAASTFQYVFGAPEYTVGVGEQVTVPVYLLEIVNSESSILATEGIGTIGVRLSYDSSTTATRPATIADDADITPGDHFSDELDDFFTTYVGTAVSDEGPGAANPVAGISAIAWSPVYGDFITESRYSVLIGEFTFTAGDVVGETTVIKASDLFTDRYDTTTYDYGTPLDAGIWSTTTTIVTAVPEPGTWAGLAGMGLMAGAYWRWKSRARAKAKRPSPR